MSYMPYVDFDNPDWLMAELTRAWYTGGFTRAAFHTYQWNTHSATSGEPADFGNGGTADWRYNGNFSGLTNRKALCTQAPGNAQVAGGSAGTVSNTSANGVSPITITMPVAHGLIVNDTVGIAGVLGCTAANGKKKVLTVPSTTTFTIAGTSNGNYISGGRVNNLVEGGATRYGTQAGASISLVLSTGTGNTTTDDGTLVNQSGVSSVNKIAMQKTKKWGCLGKFRVPQIPISGAVAGMGVADPFGSGRYFLMGAGNGFGGSAVNFNFTYASAAGPTYSALNSGVVLNTDFNYGCFFQDQTNWYFAINGGAYATGSYVDTTTAVAPTPIFISNGASGGIQNFDISSATYFWEMD